MRKTLIVVLIVALVLCSCTAPTYDPSKVEQDVSSVSSDTSSDPSNSPSSDVSEMDFSFTDRELSGEYKETGATKIVFSGSKAQISGSGASASDGEVIIKSEGTFILSGSAQNVMITVSAGDSDKVQLILDGASIKNQSKPAIYVKSADKVFITTKEGTESFLTDGGSYQLSDGDTTLDGVIFSKADLAINGKGTLNITGGYKHGIVSKDDLVIVSCTLSVTAKNVGLDGKDCVMINGADIDINAGSDGIRSDNAEDADRGYVYVENANLNIKSGNDGIQAETVLKLVGSDVSVISGKSSSSPLSSSSESYKGFKAGKEIFFTDGNYVVDSQDDSIHSNGNVTISGGIFEMSSGDDGIHADSDIVISGGEISITKSYEGIEGSKIIVSGGNISIVASDDGLNAAGGNDGSAMNGRPGMGWFGSSTGSIEISGGYILVDAMGDGIDSNGPFDMSGGIVLVSGPTNGGNGAFDHDGAATVTGGVLIATGSAGMASGFSSAENQGAMFVSFASQKGGSSIAVVGEDEKVILSFTPEKDYQTAVITSPDVQVGKSYDIVLGAVVTDTDENGFTQNGTYSGGNVSQTVEMTSSIYGYGGGMFGGGGFHGGGFPNSPGGGRQPGGWGQRP